MEHRGKGPLFNKKCSWTPDSSKATVYIDNYVQAIRNGIFKELQNTNKRKNNHSEKDHRTLSRVQSRCDIIIPPSDKQG